MALDSGITSKLGTKERPEEDEEISESHSHSHSSSHLNFPSLLSSSNRRGGLNIASLVNLPYIHHEFAPKNDISARVWDQFLGVAKYFEDYSALCVNQRVKTFSTLGYLSEQCLQYHPCLEIVHVPMMDHKSLEAINNTLSSLIEQHQGCNVVFHLAVDQQANYDVTSEQFPQGTTSFIKDAYYDARKEFPIRCLYDTKVMNIGVHIRRGDVSATQNAVGRFVSNEAYFKILSNLTEVLESLNFREELSKTGLAIHIFSEGEPEDFEDIQKLPGVVFHLNEDLFETLHNLALADVFVGSISGFSSFAKKIARGITIFPFTKPGNGVQIHIKRAIFEVEAFLAEWKERKRELRTLPVCER